LVALSGVPRLQMTSEVMHPIRLRFPAPKTDMSLESATGSDARWTAPERFSALDAEKTHGACDGCRTLRTP
jgi:hypothetical protein